jgi:Tfp pilus assembly protein PilO
MLALLITSYIIFCVQDRQLEILAADEQLEMVKSELQGYKLATLSATKPEMLKIEIEQLKDNINNEQDTLAGFEEDFTDLTMDDAIASVRKDITYLCDANGLRITSINRSNIELVALAGEKSNAKENVSIEQQVLARPQFSFGLIGSYSEFKSFLFQLNQLPYMVVVTQIDLRAAQKDEVMTGLAGRLTLAF